MKWDVREEEVLKRLWIRQDMDRFLIAEILTNRTPSAISKHASELNLKKESKISIDIKKLKEIELYEI